MIPLKVTARIPIIQVSVVRAFFHSGGLKAGTPSEIASTPVSAAQPELNARSTSRTPSEAVASGASSTGSWTSNPSAAFRAIPTMIMTMMPTRKR